MVTDKVTYWLDIANYDLETAEAMFQTGRWLYVAFMCHQVIEKTFSMLLPITTLKLVTQRIKRHWHKL